MILYAPAYQTMRLCIALMINMVRYDTQKQRKRIERYKSGKDYYPLYINDNVGYNSIEDRRYKTLKRYLPIHEVMKGVRIA